MINSVVLNQFTLRVKHTVCLNPDRRFYDKFFWSYRILLHRQIPTGCSKSAAGLLSCSHEADIRIRLHRLHDDIKSAASWPCRLDAV